MMPGQRRLSRPGSADRRLIQRLETLDSFDVHGGVAAGGLCVSHHGGQRQRPRIGLGQSPHRVDADDAAEPSDRIEQLAVGVGPTRT